MVGDTLQGVKQACLQGSLHQGSLHQGPFSKQHARLLLMRGMQASQKAASSMRLHCKSDMQPAPALLCHMQPLTGTPLLQLSHPVGEVQLCDPFLSFLTSVRYFVPCN
eukprot:1159090-Pelagomonas_calceolata.AAC.6